MPAPIVPIDHSIEFLHGYLSREAPDIQFEIIANLLLWFFVEHATDPQAEEAIKSIWRSVPVARAAAFANMPVQGTA